MATLVNDSGLFTMAEFRHRGILKLAPDILVYIAGDLGARVIAPVSGESQNIDFNDGITTVGIQNNIDPPGSSTATIEITTPLYGENSNYWTKFENDGKTFRIPVFVPMMEIRIYAKGRYLVNFQPKYYPVFWGFITNVEENFSGGVWKINLNCADMLHWWEYSQVNIHPIPETNQAIGGGQTITAYSTIFTDANPFTIMWRLAMDMYVSKKDENVDIVNAALHRFVTPTWLAQKNSLSQIYPPQVLREAAVGIMRYWNSRFGELGTLLKMYGAKGKEIPITDKETGRKIVALEELEIPTQDPSMSKKKRASNTRIVKKFDVDTYLNNFTVFFEFDNMGEFSDAEYMSKLEIATEVKNRVEYEFFQDVDGAFIFKPPFYNLNTKYVEPYVIRPYDIINNSFQTDADGIVTVLEIKCPFHGQIRSTEYPNSIGFHMDVDLAKRYGIKYKTMNLQYIRSNARVANQLALGHLGMINSKAFTGTVMIPGRPEIRLGYPVYMDHRDSFHYVRSINHSFDYGGSFTTTLSLEAERQRVYTDDNYTYGEPLKDRVYLFTGNLAAVTGKNTETGKKGTDYIPITEEEQKQLDDQGLTLNDLKAKSLLRNSQRLVSNAQGRYEISTIEDAEKVIKGKKKIEGSTTYDYAAVTDWTVPYTDEEGYRVIGSFRYGRGLSVTGKTRLTADEIQKLGETEGKALARINQNGQIVNMIPGSYAESEKMRTFFSLVPENEEGVIPNYVDLSSISLTESNWKIASDGISSGTEQVTNMTAGENKKSDKLLPSTTIPK